MAEQHQVTPNDVCLNLDIPVQPVNTRQTSSFPFETEHNAAQTMPADEPRPEDRWYILDEARLSHIISQTIAAHEQNAKRRRRFPSMSVLTLGLLAIAGAAYTYLPQPRIDTARAQITAFVARLAPPAPPAPHRSEELVAPTNSWLLENPRLALGSYAPSVERLVQRPRQFDAQAQTLFNARAVPKSPLPEAAFVAHATFVPEKKAEPVAVEEEVAEAVVAEPKAPEPVVSLPPTQLTWNVPVPPARQGAANEPEGTDLLSARPFFLQAR